MGGTVQIFAAFGPLVLTVMGIIVSLDPPEKRSKWHYAWLGGFLLIGLPTSVATYAEMTSADKTSSDTNTTVHDLQTDNKALSSNLQSISKSLGLNPGSPLGDILLKIDALTPHVMHAMGGAVFNTPTVSGEISVHSIKTKPTKINLPKFPFVGERLDIADTDGNAASGPISVYGNGYLIDGQKEYSMPFSHQSITVTFDGRTWDIN